MKTGNQSIETDFILSGLFQYGRMGTFLFVAIVILFAVALMGNIILILLIRLDTRLHTPMYLLLSQLSFIDIMNISTTVPKMTTDFLTNSKTITFLGCEIQTFVFIVLGGTEALLLGFMSYDRYVAICHPLHYPVLMSKKICWFMVTCAWTSGSINALGHTLYAGATLSFPYCHSREINHFFCEAPSLVRLACADTTFFEFFMYVCCILMLLIPLSLILASYSLILAAVLCMKSTAAQKKAFATCSSHLAVVGLFYGTLIFTYMRPKSYHSVAHDKVVSAFYTIFTPVLNPLIYSVRNKDVKGALRKWLEKHFLGHL
uniref:Olfactory receptor n=1 Tax=Ursus maritimus TaxID=29073 RepID=A0A452VL08_URSMA